MVTVSLTIRMVFFLPTYMHFLGLGNFTKVVRVCALRLWSDPRLPKVWEALVYRNDLRGIFYAFSTDSYKFKLTIKSKRKKFLFAYTYETADLKLTCLNRSENCDVTNANMKETSRKTYF
jgi:hypothetical protein